MGAPASGTPTRSRMPSPSKSLRAGRYSGETVPLPPTVDVIARALKVRAPWQWYCVAAASLASPAASGRAENKSGLRLQALATAASTAHRAVLRARLPVIGNRSPVSCVDHLGW